MRAREREREERKGSKKRQGVWSTVHSIPRAMKTREGGDRRAKERKRGRKEGEEREREVYDLQYTVYLKR